MIARAEHKIWSTLQVLGRFFYWKGTNCLGKKWWIWSVKVSRFSRGTVAPKGTCIRKFIRRCFVMPWPVWRFHSVVHCWHLHGQCTYTSVKFVQLCKRNGGWFTLWQPGGTRSRNSCRSFWHLSHGERPSVVITIPRISLQWSDTLGTWRWLFADLPFYIELSWTIHFEDKSFWAATESWYMIAKWLNKCKQSFFGGRGKLAFAWKDARCLYTQMCKPYLRTKKH